MFEDVQHFVPEFGLVGWEAVHLTFDPNLGQGANECLQSLEKKSKNKLITNQKLRIELNNF